MNTIIKFLKKIESIKDIVKKISAGGGIAYLVGGSVRDLVLQRDVKDIDIEVHKISLEDLQKCLELFGSVSLVGKQFGVFKSHDNQIDWSLPRRDSKGRKPTVVVDKNLTIKQASRRRDITMNAMAIDLAFVCDNLEIIKNACSTLPAGEHFLSICTQSFRIVDPYNGLEDMKNKTLRVVDKTLFVEDPLRFYRVMQFVGRFEMLPDDELDEICRTMDLRDVAAGGEIARERIYEEMKKLLLKSKRPSLGFLWLKKIGRLDELFPEIGILATIEQRPDYHPEGNVFEHTMQSIDAAASFPVGPSERLKTDDEKFMIMLAVLCHDFGKAVSSDKEGRSHGHDVVGVPIAKKFLQRFTWNSFLIRAVCKLVRYHMMPLLLLEQKSSPRAYKRLALKLAPEVTPQHLYLVSLADVRGRNPERGRPLPAKEVKNVDMMQWVSKNFLENIAQANVETGPEKAVLKGRDLIDVVPPGPKLGELLRRAYKIQIDEGIADKEILKKRVLEGL